MALIVEDGTARADADSYVSVAEADQYLGDRGYDAWASLDPTAKEQALRKATDFMGTYRPRWTGVRVKITQALDWPRYDVPMRDASLWFNQYYPYDQVPAGVKNACAVLALKSITTTLAPDLKPPKTRVRVGKIEADYARGDRQTTIYQDVESILLPFFFGGSGSNRLVVRA